MNILKIVKILKILKIAATQLLRFGIDSVLMILNERMTDWII